MLTLSDFDYELPEALIAQTPMEPRDSSRLLVLDRNTGFCRHEVFSSVLNYIGPGDLLVANDTMVFPARLIGTLADTGGKAEVFLLHRQSLDTWDVLVKPGKKLLPGRCVHFGENLSCEVLSCTEYGGRRVRFLFDGVFETILDGLGETPLPPYIHQKLKDPDRYQTVYARERGSAAAPTAGLHFTPQLMDLVRQKGAEFAFITLNIGLGTFRPVRALDLDKHVMHREFFSISPTTAERINRTKAEGGRIIAVGTTSVRTVEAAAKNGLVLAESGWTDIFIRPGYRFQIIDALITNFHLPQSTLLMLISAFAGRDNVLAAYAEAVRNKYRFFSFGDAMFIF